MIRNFLKIIPVIVFVSFIVCILAGCGSNNNNVNNVENSRSFSNVSDTPNNSNDTNDNANANENSNDNVGRRISGTPDSTDQLFSRYEDHATFYVFGFDKKALSSSDFEPVDVGEEIKDGHFYKVIADVEFLNGGVAGYVNHPEIKKVYEVTEVNPSEMDIAPLSGQHYYGLSTIGDYADGDILLFEYVKGVWQDGQWIYTYHDSLVLDDGRVALITDNKEITKDIVQAGIDSGVLSCEDYFVMPLRDKQN